MKRPDLMWTQDEAEIGPFLRQVRISAGLMQKDLADQLGHTASFVANVEKGKSLPSTPNLFRWFRILGIQFMAQVKDGS